MGIAITHDIQQQYANYAITLLLAGLKIMRVLAVNSFSRWLSVAQSKKTTPHHKEVETSFQLADAVFAKAKVDCQDKVMLWLGANVMLEYDINDAKELLSNNKGNAIKSLEDVNEQMAFLRDQMTTTEVSMARVYNWDVNRRKAANLK